MFQFTATWKQHNRCALTSVFFATSVRPMLLLSFEAQRKWIWCERLERESVGDQRLQAESWLMPQCEPRVWCFKQNYNDFKTLVFPSALLRLLWMKHFVGMNAASLWPSHLSLSLPRLFFFLLDYWLVSHCVMLPFWICIVTRLQLPLRTPRLCP